MVRTAARVAVIVHPSFQSDGERWIARGVAGCRHYSAGGGASSARARRATDPFDDGPGDMRHRPGSPRRREAPPARAR